MIRQERMWGRGVIGMLLAVWLWGGCAGPPPPVQSPTAPLFDNLGVHHHPVTTTSSPAQRYFDQGLIWAFAFNHAEAIRSFREAARLDPDCAMCYWGIAYALGPNINAPMDEAAARKAFAALQEARKRASRASQVEQAYIGALSRRYAADPGGDRYALDRAYADAMRELARAYPDDLDAAVLFAEALMDTTPWNYWTEDGRPRAVTTEIVGTLESVLARNPSHPFALHLYIHAVESSADPQRGEDEADRLVGLVPGAGHLVHMPAHIYLRIGRYDDVVRLNALAAEADEVYFAQAQAQGLYPAAYYPHNIHFLWQASLIEGRSQVALAAARKLVSVLPAEQVRAFPMVEPLLATPWITLVQFGRWSDMLAQPAPPSGFVLQTAFWHYAQGMALAAQGQLKEAEAERAILESMEQGEGVRQFEVRAPMVPARRMVAIAHHVLAAELAKRLGQVNEQIRHLEAAVRIEDGLPYMEPPYWPVPVRQNLGPALLARGQAKEAEAVFRADLTKHPRNGWSLFGLANSLRAQGKKEEAAKAQQRFEQAWVHADVTLSQEPR